MLPLQTRSSCWQGKTLMSKRKSSSSRSLPWAVLRLRREAPQQQLGQKWRSSSGVDAFLVIRPHYRGLRIASMIGKTSLSPTNSHSRSGWRYQAGSFPVGTSIPSVVDRQVPRWSSAFLAGATHHLRAILTFSSHSS